MAFYFIINTEISFILSCSFMISLDLTIYDQQSPQNYRLPAAVFCVFGPCKGERKHWRCLATGRRLSASTVPWIPKTLPPFEGSRTLRGASWKRRGARGLTLSAPVEIKEAQHPVPSVFTTMLVLTSWEAGMRDGENFRMVWWQVAAYLRLQCHHMSFYDNGDTQEACSENEFDTVADSNRIKVFINWWRIDLSRHEYAATIDEHHQEHHPVLKRRLCALKGR